MSGFTLPRLLWRLCPCAYRLRIAATDAAGNRRTLAVALRARAG